MGSEPTLVERRDQKALRDTPITTPRAGEARAVWVTPVTPSPFPGNPWFEPRLQFPSTDRERAERGQ